MRLPESVGLLRDRCEEGGQLPRGQLDESDVAQVRDENRSMYWVCDSRVVGRIPTRVDNQYRSHCATVHDRLVCSSRDRPSTSSRARRAATSVR